MPWIDSRGGSFEIVIVHADKNRQLSSISLSTIDGKNLEAKVEAIADLPAALSKFNDLPEGFRGFFKISFQLNQPETVLCDAISKGKDLSLFTLTPKIQYPVFLFDIVAQASHKLPGTTFKSMVETGTLYGHTAIHASRLFDQVYSIELNTNLHRNATKINRSISNIEFIHGDSGVEVTKLIEKLHHPTVFFLDAHWSGDTTVNWESSRFSGFPTDTSHTGSSASAPTSVEQVPLDKEINAILDKFPHEALIIIDDWQSVGKKDHAFIGEDWSHLTQLQLINQFRNSNRTAFQYPYDDKHYVIGLGEA